MDFGLLSLTAQVAKLTLRWRKEDEGRWEKATIFLENGERIGSLRMNSSTRELEGDRSERKVPGSGGTYGSEEGLEGEFSGSEIIQIPGTMDLDGQPENRFSGTELLERKGIHSLDED